MTFPEIFTHISPDGLRKIDPTIDPDVDVQSELALLDVWGLKNE